MDDVVISITKDKICVNGIEINNDNYEDVFITSGLSETDMRKIIRLITARIKHKNNQPSD